jgi:hypothetical protein
MVIVRLLLNAGMSECSMGVRDLPISAESLL